MGLVINILIKHIKSNKKLYNSFNFSYKTQKYRLKNVLEDIIYILRTGISYRQLRSNIKWQTVYKVYRKLVDNHIFDISYQSMLSKYIKKVSKKRLSYISSDTSFIRNKNGKQLIGYNKYYSKKNGNKVSIIVDSKGIPLDVNICKGNQNDSKILSNQLDKWNLIKDNHLEQYNKYFLADAGYDSTLLRDKLSRLNYEPIIVQNKRNIKNDMLINTFDRAFKKIYSKRIVVENSFCKLKQLRRIDQRYDSLLSTFNGYLKLGIIMIFF